MEEIQPRPRPQDDLCPRCGSELDGTDERGLDLLCPQCDSEKLWDREVEAQADREYEKEQAIRAEYLAQF